MGDNVSGKTVQLLTSAIADARARGWTTTDVSVDAALKVAHALNVPVSPTRQGENSIAVLRPTAKDAAHPRSLSARYGLDAFPLHTDCAHQANPPDVVLLSAPSPSSVATLIRPIDPASLHQRQRWAMQSGVFLVGRGKNAFFVHAIDKQGRLRFDPGCMTPVDPAARYITDWLRATVDEADRHCWRSSGITVVIDNTRSLHGRSAVANHEERVLRRLMLHWGAHDDAV